MWSSEKQRNLRALSTQVDIVRGEGIDKVMPCLDFGDGRRQEVEKDRKTTPVFPTPPVPQLTFVD